jgi:nitrogenase-stabilizing/protective protein
MSSFKETLSTLSSAEEFLNFLEVDYDPGVVNVKRLHILKRFNQYLARSEVRAETDLELKAQYRALLKQAYEDFVTSDAVTEKVFKVFQDAAGIKTYSLDNLRATLRNP